MPVDSYFPVREITPYNRNWTIKARVVSKAEMRSFRNSNTNAGTEGQLFSVNLLDKEGGQIKATFFNQAAVDFNTRLEEGKVYTFSKGTAKVADKRYNNTKHDYEITFNSDAVVQTCDDDEAIGTALPADYIDLKTLKNKPLPTNGGLITDLIGVITEVRPMTEIITGPNSKNPGQKLPVSRIKIADESQAAIEITIFGEALNQKYPMSESMNGNVVGLKSVLIRKFNERSGTLNDGGSMIDFSIDNNFNAANAVHKERVNSLKAWWSGFSGKLTDMTVYSGRGTGETAEQITMNDLVTKIEPKMHEKDQSRGQLYEVIGRMSRVITTRRDENVPLSYLACQKHVPSPNGQPGTIPCQKKVEQSGGSYSCTNRCGTISKDEAKYRWIVRSYVSDYTDQHIVNVFDESFTQMSGLNADITSSKSPEELEQMMKGIASQGLFKMRFRSKLEENPNDGTYRPKHNVTSVVTLEGDKLCDYGLELIEEMKRM